MSKKEIKKSAGKLHSNKEYRESLKWFKESGLEVSDLVAGLHMEELVFKNGKTFSNINHIAFNGISADKKTLGFSPCVHASVWICIYHCGMWALINGIAGVACSAICGYAFAYACS